VPYLLALLKTINGFFISHAMKVGVKQKYNCLSNGNVDNVRFCDLACLTLLLFYLAARLAGMILNATLGYV
jgi:hypothetical protein